MSYDLFVFSNRDAPRDREEFLDWYDAQTEWEDGRSYDDPSHTTPELRAWFEEMIKTFPPRNGRYRREYANDEDRAPSEYGINSLGIYISFSYAVADEAHKSVMRAAAKCGVGFFDASSETGAVWVPDGAGGLRLLHQSEDEDA